MAWFISLLKHINESEPYLICQKLSALLVSFFLKILTPNESHSKNIKYYPNKLTWHENDGRNETIEDKKSIIPITKHLFYI